MPDKSAAGPKESLRILNSREKKEINAKIIEQWGVMFDKEQAFLMNNKGRLYIATRDISMIDLEKLRVDKIGLYVANVSDKGIRLTVEGTQMLGPVAKKNVLEITEEEMHAWFYGKDIPRSREECRGCEGYVMIRYPRDSKHDFLGCGKVTDKAVLNFMPKSRRINEGNISN